MGPNVRDLGGSGLTADPRELSTGVWVAAVEKHARQSEKPQWGCQSVTQPAGPVGPVRRVEATGLTSQGRPDDGHHAGIDTGWRALKCARDQEKQGGPNRT